MRKLAIYSFKGGTAKTTSVFSLAGALAKRGMKVLCIDCDPQANLTMRLLSDGVEDAGPAWFSGLTTLEDVFQRPELVNDAVLNAPLRIKHGGPLKKRGIDIIPVKPEGSGAKPSLQEMDYMLEKGICAGSLSKALSMLRKTRSHLYAYDYVLMDFGPENNSITKEGLMAADYIVAPLSLDASSMDGIVSVEAAVKKAAAVSAGKGPIMLGYFATLYNPSTAFDASVLEGLREALGDKLMEPPIRLSTDAKWSLEIPCPLAWYKKGAPAAKDYEELLSVIEKRIAAIEGGNS